MAMTYYPLDSFAGLYQMQANGVTTDPIASPAGIPGRLEIVDDPLGLRGRVVRAQMWDTDIDNYGGVRAEMRLENMVNGEYWWQWYAMVDAVPPSGQTIVYNQIHKEGAVIDATEPWLLNLKNSAVQPVVPATAMATSYAVEYGQTAPIEFSKWHKYTLHMILQDASATGLRELYVDDVRVYREPNVVTAYTANKGYLKLGIYDYAHAGGFGFCRAYFSGLTFYTGAMSPNAIMDVRPPKTVTLRPSPGIPG